MAIVTVTVKVDRFGTYTKGDTIEMELSTAQAVAAHGKVEFDGMNASANEKVSGPDAIAAIEAMDDVAHIHAYTEDETRKTVLAAAAKRIEELSA